MNLTISPQLEALQRTRWYQRIPSLSMKGMRKLANCRQAHVYDTIIDLIHLNEGPIDNDPKYIAGNCCEEIGTTKARRIIDDLVSIERIYLTDDGQIFDETCAMVLTLELKVRAKKEAAKANKSKPNQFAHVVEKLRTVEALWQNTEQKLQENFKKTSRKPQENFQSDTFVCIENNDLAPNVTKHNLPPKSPIGDFLDFDDFREPSLGDLDDALHDLERELDLLARKVDRKVASDAEVNRHAELLTARHAVQLRRAKLRVENAKAMNAVLPNPKAVQEAESELAELEAAS